jgi:DNA-binding cell septation regulator SpoVG
MRVTAVRIRLPGGQAVAGDPGVRLLAYATVELDAALVLSHLRVLVNGHGRRVVEMPSRPSGVGRYVDVAYPITEDLRTHLREQVLAEVSKHYPEEGA